MSFICKLCSTDFSLKKNLNKHLDLKKCKNKFDYRLINEKLEQLEQLKQLKIENTSILTFLN
jgi:hypothetical protein